MALRQRPDLRAAQLGVTAAQSQFALAKANGKSDVSVTVQLQRTSAASTPARSSATSSCRFSIATRAKSRARSFAITQSQELSSEQASMALTDVVNAYEALRTNDQVVQLYHSGYLKEAEDSRDISQYAYQRGAASLLDFLDAERSYRATELAYRQALATYMLARTIAPSRGHQEPAMRHAKTVANRNRQRCGDARVPRLLRGAGRRVRARRMRRRANRRAR